MISQENIYNMKFLKKYRLFESKVIGFEDNKQGNFVVVAGGPGSGKSFVSHNLINLKDYKYVNVDTLRELMAKKLNLDLKNPEDNLKILKMTYTTSDPRNRTIRFLKNFLKIEKNELPNIIFDAGGGQTDVIRTINSLAKELNYETTLVHVKTDIDIALERNRKRERVLSDEMVIDYHDRVKKSIKILKDIFDNVWQVNNNEKWDLINRPSDRIFKLK